MSNRLLQRLARGPIVCAEGYLFELERRGWIQIGPFVPEVVLDDPPAVAQLHREFVRCGTDVIEAFTYYGHREKMKLVGKEHLLEDLNRQALKLAWDVRHEFPELDLMVAGNISNTTVYFENNTKADNDKIERMFNEQLEWAAEGNVDFVIGETFDYVEEAKMALKAIQKYNLPSVITLAIHFDGKTLCGKSPEEACKILKDEGADVVGLNCSRGPATMLPLLKRIREVVEGPIAALPVGYRTNEKAPTFQSLTPRMEDKYCDLDSHTCTRKDFSDFAKECMAMNVTYIGCCCGGAPHHVRAMAEALGRKPIASKYSPNLSKHFVYGREDAGMLKAGLEARNLW